MEVFDDCSYCGGSVTERETQKVCFWGDNLIALIDNVPAGVCKQCGEKYYKAQTLKIIDKILKERKEFETKIQVPFADFAQARAN